MISGPVIRRFGDFPLQLNITCSPLGEVIKIENSLFKLPIAAQRLSLGANFEEHIQQIKAYERLLRYKIPFAIAQQKDSKDIQDLVEKIRSIPAATRIASLPDANTWIQQLYKAIKTHKYLLEPDKNKSYFEWTESEHRAYKDKNGIKSLFKGLYQALFEFDNPDLSLSDLQIKDGFAHLATPILREVVLIRSGEMKFHRIYNAFSYHVSSKNRDLLLAHFNDPEKRYYLSDIVEALIPYKDPLVYKTLLNYWNSENQPHNWIRLSIIKHFANYQNKEVKEIAWQLFHANNIEEALLGIKILKGNGISEKTIARKLKQFLKDKDQGANFRKIVACFNHLENPFLYPSAETLLGYYKKYKTENIGSSLGKVLSKNYNGKAAPLLLEFMKDKDEKIRKTALIIIRETFTSINATPQRIHYFSEQLPAYLIKQLKKMLFDESKDIKVNALSRLYSQKVDKELFQILLDKIERDEDLRSLAMKKLNRELEKWLMPQSIIPVYLEQLSSSDANIKKLAVEGLRYFNSHHIDLKVESLLMDADKEVATMAKDYLDMKAGKKERAPKLPSGLQKILDEMEELEQNPFYIMVKGFKRNQLLVRNFINAKILP